MAALKIIGFAVWMCLVLTASAYGTITWMTARQHTASSPEGPKTTEFVRPRSISVPVVSAGAVQGYIIAQVTFQVNSAHLKAFGQKPDPILIDEVFRMLYAAEDFDFKKMQKQDLSVMANTIKENLNTRFGRPLVQEVLMQELTYLTKADARGRPEPLQSRTGPSKPE